MGVCRIFEGEPTFFLVLGKLHGRGGSGTCTTEMVQFGTFCSIFDKIYCSKKFIFLYKDKS